MGTLVGTSKSPSDGSRETGAYGLADKRCAGLASAVGCCESRANAVYRLRGAVPSGVTFETPQPALQDESQRAASRATFQ